MKKYYIFTLILLIMFFISPQTANAQNSKFHEAEYISNIFTKSSKNGITKYQQGRITRKNDTNEAVYCIDPWKTLDPDITYNGETKIPNVSEEITNQIRLIAYYGYNYGTHTDSTWYMITQVLIWKTMDPGGEYYFTDTLNGNKITSFENKEQEILDLVKEHYNLPSFANRKETMLLGERIKLIDNHNIFHLYTPEKVEGLSFIPITNAITITAEKKGNYNIQFHKKNSIQKESYFYYHDISQPIMTRGKSPDVSFNITINVTTGSITIEKEDKDKDETNKHTELNGAIYEVYDENRKKIGEIKIDETNTGTLENLKKGIYYIKEIKAGKGYTIDPKEYTVEINSNQPNITIKLQNEQIKSHIKINKKYGNYQKDDFLPEKNIIFEIYNDEEKLIDTITTNEQGETEITLSYGTYLIKQKNTTEGYEKIDDFSITIDENSEKEILLEFINPEIITEVPDTGL